MCIDTLERGGRGEREREEHLSVASCKHPDLALNLQPFGLWDDTPTNQAAQARA